MQHQHADSISWQLLDIFYPFHKQPRDQIQEVLVLQLMMNTPIEKMKRTAQIKLKYSINLCTETTLHKAYNTFPIATRCG